MKIRWRLKQVEKMVAKTGYNGQALIGGGRRKIRTWEKDLQYFEDGKWKKVPTVRKFL